MRPTTLVAGAALTAALALVALPGLVGSQSPRPDRPIDAAAFQAVRIEATNGGSSVTIDPLDAAQRSADSLDANSILVEPGRGRTIAFSRPAAVQPDVKPGFAIKPPKYKLTGVATFYDAGFTAMRLPRGTVIRVCGPGGCIDRVVSDYGPVAGSDRIIDLYRPDFFRVCGCPSWSGTIKVTVSVY
ncbi:MAG TPA: hypothetical protein VE817_00265 [Candidatus Acidoferrum sp.]|nr:hypothetical protein [Candidatus Acidoferrum sp.]